MTYKELVEREKKVIKGLKFNFIAPEDLTIEKSTSSYGNYCIRVSNGHLHFTMRKKEAEQFIKEARETT